MDAKQDVGAGAHLESLNLLEEVHAYLRRLPAHPMHSELAGRIRRHLDAPGADVLQHRLKELAKDQELAAKITSGTAMKGVSRFTPGGAPVILAKMVGGNLRLESPAVESALSEGGLAAARQLADAIGREVAAGVDIPMRPADPALEREVMRKRISTNLEDEDRQHW